MQYLSKDGLVFDSYKECEKHERALNDIKAYKVTFHTGYVKFVLIHTSLDHTMLLEYFLSTRFGCRIMFDGKMRERYSVTALNGVCNPSQLPETACVLYVETPEVPRLWVDGILLGKAQESQKASNVTKSNATQKANGAQKANDTQKANATQRPDGECVGASLKEILKKCEDWGISTVQLSDIAGGERIEIPVEIQRLYDTYSRLFTK